jgi:hypothetical protein
LGAPQRDLAQFGGSCANGMICAVPCGGGWPNTWRIYRGNLHLLGGQALRDHFKTDAERNLEPGQEHWSDEVAGAWAITRRYKRLVFRALHCKTGKELQDRWRTVLAAKTLPLMLGAAKAVPQNSQPSRTSGVSGNRYQ